MRLKLEKLEFYSADELTLAYVASFCIHRHVGIYYYCIIMPHRKIASAVQVGL